MDYVYDMTWAEFRLRLHAYRRQEKDKLYMLRELAWVTYIAPHQNPKKMKKSKEAFWSLSDKKKNPINDQMRELMKGAIKKYNKELSEKDVR